MLRSLVLFALSLPLAAQTFIVDANNGPGTNFRDIPAAIAQVPDGAVLQVRAGGYSPFVVTNKSLTILGESRTTVGVFGFTVGPLTAANRVVVKDVGTSGGALVTGAQGHVVIDSVRLGFPLVGNLLLVVQDSPDVHLVDVTQFDPRLSTGTALEVTRSCVEITGCTFIGGSQRTATATGLPGVAASHSRLSVYRSTIVGGIGGSDGAFEFGNGGPGLLAVASQVDLGPGTTATGGEGGSDPDSFSQSRLIMRPGGPGLQLTQSAARAFGTTLRGGCSAGRLFGSSGCTSTAPNLAVDASSSFTTPPGTAPTTRVQGVMAPNSFVDVVLDAAPNQLALLAFGFTPACVALPEVIDFGGILTAPEIVFGPFVTDAAGTASFRLQLPANFVRDRMVWAQYFTFPGAVLPGMGSNTVAIVVRS